MVVAIPTLHIINDLFAADITEIHVNIRHRHALGIQKPLKKQRVFQRVNIRDAEDIRYNAPRCRAPARSYGNAMFPRIIDEIPNDQEIAVEPHLMDNAQLIFHAFPNFRRNGLIPSVNFLFAKLAKIRFVRQPFRQRESRQDMPAEGKFHITPLGNLCRVFHRIRIFGKKLRHLLRRLHIEFVVLEAHTPGIFQRLSRLNAEQYVVKIRILFMGIMRVVRHDKSDAVFPREANESLRRLLLFWYAVLLQLDEEVVLSENIDIFGNQLVRPVRLILNQSARYLARDAGGQADNALMVEAQKLLIHARLIVSSLNIRKGNELHEIPIPRIVLCQQNQMIITDAADLEHILARRRSKIYFAADDRLDARLFRRLVKLHDAVHLPVVSDGDSVHAEFFHFVDQFADAACTIQQTILRMHMQVRKMILHAVASLHSRNNSYFYIITEYGGEKKRRKRSGLLVPLLSSYPSILHFFHDRRISRTKVGISHPFRFRIPFQIIAMRMRLDVVEILKGQHQRSSVQRRDVRFAGGHPGMKIPAVDVNLHFSCRGVIPVQLRLCAAGNDEKGFVVLFVAHGTEPIAVSHLRQVFLIDTRIVAPHNHMIAARVVRR